MARFFFIVMSTLDAVCRVCGLDVRVHEEVGSVAAWDLSFRLSGFRLSRVYIGIQVLRKTCFDPYHYGVFLYEVGVSENRGLQHSTLKSRILIIRTPK